MKEEICSCGIEGCTREAKMIAKIPICLVHSSGKKLNTLEVLK